MNMSFGDREPIGAMGLAFARYLPPEVPIWFWRFGLFAPRPLPSRRFVGLLGILAKMISSLVD